jgi:fluoride ion exporter CrcB/FEX
MWFLVVGNLLSFSGCLLCLASGLRFSPGRTYANQWTHHLLADQWPLALAAVNMLAALVGGLGLLGAGIGLRAERPSAATAALIAAACLSLIEWSSSLVHASREQWVPAIVYAVPAMTNSILFLIAAGCRSTFREFPPPADQNVATKEFLEEYAAQRRQRRGFD